MGSFFCKQRRGLTTSRTQRREKLQQQRRDCLLRAPCMLCFLVREPAASEPVSPAPPAPDRVRLLLLNSWQERSRSVLHSGLPRSPEPASDSLTADMVCKRKNSGEQPGAPCKQPRCSEGEQAQELSAEQPHPGDQGHHSAQHYQDLTNTEEPPRPGDHGHHSAQHYQDLTPTEEPPRPGDHGHHSAQHYQDLTPTEEPPRPGDPGHHSAQHYQDLTPTEERPRPGDHGHHSAQHYQDLTSTEEQPRPGEHGHHSAQHYQDLTSTERPHPGEQGHHSAQHYPDLTPTEQPHPGDQGHHSAQHYQDLTPTEERPRPGEQGHHSTQHYKDLTPTEERPCPGEQGHYSTQHYKDLTPSVQPAEGIEELALECPEKDVMPLSQTATVQSPPTYGAAPTGQMCCASSCFASSSSSLLSPSQDQPQTLREADPDAQKVEDEPLNINQLPPSLLLKIFSHLSLNERCLCVSLVCKYWRDLCLDFQFWKHLDLSSRCQVKDDVLERIASRFRNITELNISDCLNVTDAGVGMVAARCSGLVKYTAYRCKQLSDSSLISLTTHCTSLQKVHVGNQDRLTDEAIKQLGSRCKDLRDIHFGQCYKISDEGMTIIAKGCPKLKRIYMQENKLVSDKSMEAFAEHCPELEYVGFMGCAVTSRGVICLTNLKLLSSLDLRHINELDNETVMEIVKKCRKLTSLNLCLNRNIDDRCVEVIAKEGRSLKELYLVTCKITDHALIAIGRYSTTIETVDVGWCKEITDQGATLIAQSSKSIRYLGLMRCDQVNEATVEQLVQQYPHITFSTVLQDCKRTLERAYQMGWTPNPSSAS